MTVPEPEPRALIRPRDDLRALAGYHSPQLDVEIRLNTNESPYAPPPAFVDAWIDELRAMRFNRYPDRDATELRQAIAARVPTDPSRVFCANGSNEVLQTVLLTYGGASRCALVFEPTYALHAHIARVTGTAIVAADRDASYQVPADALDGLLAETGASVVFVCSPNNPTGTVESPETVETALAAARRHGALLVVDEAYGEFSPHSAIGLVADDAPLVVVRTYSKVWSMAALRLGYCVASPTIVNELAKVALPYSLDAPTQAAGRVALDFADEMEARVRELVAERERIVSALDRVDGLEPVPSGANFVLVRAEQRGARLWAALVERGVLVRDFSSWPGIEGCVRITVGTPIENDAMLAAVAAAMKEIS